ncbi:MAG: hypothetical protein Q9168_000032 [Polycauliona sp. 1 TL-2023]
MAPIIFPATAVLALAMSAFAQSSMSAQTSASIFIVNADPQSLVGSIVGMDGPTTTYQIRCTDDEECGFPGPFTYIKDGTSSIEYAVGIQGLYVLRQLKSPAARLTLHLSTATIDCSLDGTVSAVCTGSGELAPQETGAPAETASDATTLSGDQFMYTQIPIIAAAAAIPTGAAATATSTSPPSKQSSTATRSTSSQAGSTSSPSSPSSGQANAAGSTGSTGGATNLDRSSMIALVGAAALAAVLI